mgnify:CR=1 FL=1
MENIIDLLEALTIFCFGLSWPISIRKSWVSRTAKGKSVLFEIILLVEPGQTEPKPVVLPLHHRTILLALF